jgi:hypothetical protein
MESEARDSTYRKALALNRDDSRYGTFAEIGAGQEVARWFFRVGGASGTVAKTMSAYDMVFSDMIYGPAEQYVSRKRLLTMLDHEYELLINRLGPTRGNRTSFFAFANTVKAKGYKGMGNYRAWMGIRFQSTPETPANDVIVHVWLHDSSHLTQQEALGIFGVNLIYGAGYHFSDPRHIITTLMDGLSSERIEIDMLEFRGPIFESVDNRWVNLELVRRRYTSSAIFKSDKTVLQASELLYKRPVLVCRGSFRPVFNSTLDMVELGRDAFRENLDKEDQPLEIMEISLNNLREGEVFDSEDYLARIDLLSQIGKTVMVSNRPAFHSLAAHLRRNTQKTIGLVLGAPLLEEIFDARYYEELDGGLLEAFGRLFKRDLKLYVYPVLESVTGKIKTARTISIPAHLQHLLSYLLEGGSIVEIPVKDAEVSLSDSVTDVAAKIGSGDTEWEKTVPQRIVKRIKDKHYFGWTEKKRGLYPQSVLDK